MKKQIKIIAILVLMIVIAAAVILYQNILEDTWSERLTEKSEVTQYLDFYPAGADSISAEKGVFPTTIKQIENCA